MGNTGKFSLARKEELHVGENIMSPNRQFYLTLESDGHLAIYRKNKTDKPMWKSTINPKVSNVEGPFTLRMQKDNNAVVYDGKGQPIWHTGTYKYTSDDSCHLDIDNEGNFNVHAENNKVIWTSYTALRQCKEGIEGRSALDQGDELYPGQYLVSPNEQVYLTLQSDGHIIIYKKNKHDEPLWKSTFNTELSNVQSPCVLKMQWDNNVVVYDAKEQLIWTTDTCGYSYDCRLMLEDDGNLLLHRKDDTTHGIWSTNHGVTLNFTIDTITSNRNN